MGLFFHGWRRKEGVVTLIMACALMGMWVRSYVTEDELSVPHRASLFVICSIQGHACFEYHSDHLPGTPQWEQMDLTSLPNVNVLGFKYNGMHLQWQRSFGGFNFGAGTETLFDQSRDRNIPVSDEDIDSMRKDQFSFLVVPYWSLVLPLCLLSAYLLLWPQRKRETDRISKDISN